MITAQQLTMLTTRTPVELTNMIRDAGYKGDRFTGAKFLGITNGGQFCYFVTYPLDGGTDSTKVYITFDPTVGKASADY